MGQCGTEIIISVLLVSTFSSLYLLNNLFFNQNLLKESHGQHDWLIRLLINIFNYATVFIPGFLAYRYIKRIKYLDKSNNGGYRSVIQLCLGERDDHSQNISGSSNTYQKTTFEKAFLLFFCFMGLQLSYLTWGVLQEKVMTQDYKNEAGEVAKFNDSQFLVLINRILAFCLAGSIILLTKQPRHKAPLYKYTYCSLSNILSAWCQYEALKYVTFPNQVLAKAGKVIPVMLMGKLISRTKYEYYEYFTAGILSTGMVFFLLDTGNESKGSSVTTISGLILLGSYVLFDSFTSNWQSAIFKTYGVSSIQMMCGVNLFSCMFTATSLMQQGGLVTSFDFMLQYPRFVIDCLLLSLCSALGQLVIFYTISTFGAVVFAIIMTVRQCLAILLSCLIYHHYVGPVGILGVFLVFLAVFLRIYCNQRIKFINKKKVESNTTLIKV